MRHKQEGQIILILILVMTVALAIGLSIVQKSLIDVSTASKVEQSSRAFSAAEAGIEKALAGNCRDGNCINFSENSSTADVVDSRLTPSLATSGSRQPALKFPPMAKEDVAQVWLADYNSTSNPPLSAYVQPDLDIYWGDSELDKAAIEVTLVYYDGVGSSYKPKKWYLDPDTSRSDTNRFEIPSTCSDPCPGEYKYQKRLTYSSPQAGGSMLIRVRLLYNTTSQPFAVQAVGICGTACSLPAQARSITSTGTSGDTKRKVNVFQLDKVVPPLFDYAIFSAGEISK